MTMTRPAGRPPPTARTWLLSGVPRAGTSLCCRLAGDLADVVALSEPLRYKADGGMEEPESAVARIRGFAEETRQRILAEGRAPSVQVAGRLDDNRTASNLVDGGLRRLRGGWGEIEIRKALSDRFGLLIKHNAFFASLLGGNEGPCGSRGRSIPSGGGVSAARQTAVDGCAEARVTGDRAGGVCGDRGYGDDASVPAQGRPARQPRRRPRSASSSATRASAVSARDSASWRAASASLRPRRSSPVPGSRKRSSPLRSASSSSPSVSL